MGDIEVGDPLRELVVSDREAELLGRVQELQADNDRLRHVLHQAVEDHANDENYPCEACKWTSKEWFEDA